MTENRSRFVVLCQQFLALGTVLAVASPALSVATLDIVPPAHRDGGSGMVAPATSGALVASEPVEPEVTEVPVTGVDREGVQALTTLPRLQRKTADELAALSAPEDVTGYATVGVTWKHGVTVEEDEITVSVRTRTDGAWSGWEELEYHDDHGPDPGSEEARRARPGTEPVVVGAVDEVQVKAVTDSGEAPADMQLAVIDPQVTVNPSVQQPAIDTAELEEADASLSASSTSGTTAAPTTDPTAEPTTEPTAEPTTEPTAEPTTEPTAEPTTEPTAEPTTEPTADPTSEPAPVDEGVLAGDPAWVTPKPKIFSRAQWGADERMRDKSSLKYFEVHAGFVHHTVNANSYTRAQVPSLIRGIYAYHTQSKGWSDIGYNFVVDRFGRIWEGRYGGVDRPVVGAHTLGYNEYSFAMSALGNFDKVKPSAAMLDAYGRMFAWKLSLHGVTASSSSQWVGSRSFRAINGHRDAGQTACPGRYLYAQLGTIRSLAAKYQKPFAGRTRSANLSGSRWPDLVVRHENTKRIVTVRTGGQVNFKRAHTAARGWGGKDLVATVRDVTGDGRPDLVARDRATKRTGVHPGTAAGTFGPAPAAMTKFTTAIGMTGVLDMTGDGKNDLVTRLSSGRLLLYPGNGDGGFRTKRVLADGFGSYAAIAGVGDLDRDGHNDLVARQSGRLYLFPGTGSGKLAGRVQIGTGWDQYDVITGLGDVSNDGLPDIVTRNRKSKLLYVYPGTGAGRLGDRLGPFGQMKGMTRLWAVGQLTGSGKSTDLVGMDKNGVLVVFANNGARNVERIVDSGSRIGGTNLLLNVGDWNRDGKGDVMTRVATTGVMQFRAGDGKGGFAAPVQAGTGWKNIHLVAPVGDITGDGLPDLMGQPKGGAMRIYPGNGSAGFRSSYVAHSAISSNRQTGLGLWNGDGSPDSLLRRGDGALMFYPGNGPGGLMNGKKIGSGGATYDWLQAVGDATGDGRTDLVGREKATGKLWLLPGARSGFGARRLVAGGFASYELG